MTASRAFPAADQTNAPPAPAGPVDVGPGTAGPMRVGPGTAGPTRTGPVKATVIIPTCDGGPLLGEVVRAVLEQRTPWPFSLLVVDSSSTDGSLACLEGTPARCITISRTAFNHGETRNLAARDANGDYVVFLVQDATPIGRHWLEALVEGLEALPEAVGGYARQRARGDADPALARRIEVWTPPGPAPVLKRIDHLDDYRRLPPPERIRLAAFDNVCSVVRRRHLLAHPFPRVPFGEDLCWGEAQLLLGHALAYLPGAAVWHSHRRSFRENCRRARLEHTILLERFGLRAVPDRGALIRAMGGAVTGAVGMGRGGLKRELAELIGQYQAGRRRP